MNRKGRYYRVFDAIFVASNGQAFSFGYAAGVLWSIDPLGDLPVELETSQGYQQVGATVESRSISGVTRTVTGRIVRNVDHNKRQLRDVFAPYVTGRLTIAGKYWCDAEVQRCPAISVSGLWPTFSFQLYCPNPYWRSVSETHISTLNVKPIFCLPACYDTHCYGILEQSKYLTIPNAGLDTQDWALTLDARGTVVNPGVKDPRTGEFVRFITTLQDGDKLRLFRENGILRLEQIIDDVGYDVFFAVDESSTLWTLRHGVQTWQRTADSGTEWLVLTLTFSAAFSTVVLEANDD